MWQIYLFICALDKLWLISSLWFMLNWSFVHYPDFLLVMSTTTYVVLLQLSPLMNNKNWQIMQIDLLTLVSPGIVGDISFLFPDC